MAFADALDAIEVHLVAAGAALPNPIKNVKAGPPLRVGERLIRCWYTGDGDSDLIPDTLTDNTLAEHVAIGAYWPISDAGEVAASVRDAEIHALKAEIKHRLVGDEELGGSCAASTVGDFTVDYVEVTGGWYAVLSCEVSIHLTDTDTFAD